MGREMTKYRRRYPWRRWFGQSELTLVKGVDYDVSDDSMSQQVRNAAGRNLYSRRVSVVIQPGGGSIHVLVYPEGKA
jgi:hypothetical protein